jgi:hypothetical protein
MEQSKEWDFTKLPQNEQANVLDAYERVDINTLIALHERYQLSGNSYCCGPDVGEAVYAWFGYAIDNKLIG